MKLSKKKALELACWEWELRYGDWEPLEDEPDWTLEDQVKQDGYADWVNYPASTVATMRYDGLLDNLNEKELKKLLGIKLYNAAMRAYFTGDHDT